MGRKKPTAIREAGDVYRLFKRLGKLKNERVYSVFMDGENNVLGSMEISRGGHAPWMSIHITSSIRPRTGDAAR